MAGYNSSKHAMALMDGISRIESVTLVGVGCVRWLALGRIRQILVKYGFRRAILKLKNVLFENAGNTYYEETRYITGYLTSQGVASKAVSDLCRRLKVPFQSLSSVNDDGWNQWIKDNEIDLLIYSGGGILGKEILTSLNIGVLNAHGGPLPCFRGMNGLEWSLAYGVVPEISVHMIERGIDTGPVLGMYPIEIEEGDTIERLRGKSVVKEVEALLSIIRNFEQAYLSRRYQKTGDGRQFFIMHPSLVTALNLKLKEGWRPSIPAKDFRFVTR